MKTLILILSFFTTTNITCEETIKGSEIKSNTYTYTNANPYLKLKELDASLKTLKATFKQEIYFKVADIKQNIEGEILFIKPEKLKLIHKKPYNQIIIIDSKKNIEIIKPKDKQIIRTSWEKWKNNLEPRLKGLFDFGNYSSLENDSNITSKEEKDGYIIEINSKKSDYKLILKLNKDFFPVESILDLKDTIVKTIINEFEKNIEIDPKEFEFKNNDYELIEL
jgi:outer membrane lipoprotein-sorting protein